MLSRGFFLGLLLVTSTFALAKGTPDLISISGGGLSQAIDITDSTTLNSFSPWMGQFADFQQPGIAEAPCFRHSYLVSFYMKWPERHSKDDRGDLKRIYAIRYCHAGIEGFVYLPGSGEAPYRDNIGTIYRPGQDGKWFPATDSWTRAIRNALASSEAQESPDLVTISGGKLKQPIQIRDPEVLRSFDPWNGQFVDWKQPAEGGSCGWEYEVQFFTSRSGPKTEYDQGPFHFVYGFRYCEDRDGGPGFVHLSGRNDRFGPENSPWDGLHAGKWHHATAEWKDWVEHALAAERQSD